jgi:hypothetical protein
MRKNGSKCEDFYFGGGGTGQTEETSAHGKRRGIWEDE